MASRPIWKGYIRFSLVTIPCRAYTATSSDSGKIALNQLHKGCGQRIKYQKVCPVHGEVMAAEIESGYQFAKDQYVVIDPDDLSKIRSASDKSIGIEQFIPADAVDPRFYSGRTIVLTPEGPMGKKPYSLLNRLMKEEQRVAFAKGVFSNREQLMLLRPVDNLIAATFLFFNEDVKPLAEFEPEAPTVEVDKKELELARSLISQLADEEFDLAAHTDPYAANMQKLIDAKVAGQEVVAPVEEELPQTINLMEALRKSLDSAKSKARPPKITAPSTAQKRAAAAKSQKRKTS